MVLFIKKYSLKRKVVRAEQRDGLDEENVDENLSEKEIDLEKAVVLDHSIPHLPATSSVSTDEQAPRA